MELIPGDPVNMMMAGRPISLEARENIRERLGLNRSVVYRYFDFFRRVIQGDLGESYQTRQPVINEIQSRIRATLELAAGGAIIGIFFGVTLGIISGIKPNSWIDTGIMSIALSGLSIPSFWTGMLLIYFFALRLNWFPVVGDGWRALILPAISVSLFMVGSLARLVRTSILEIMTEDYVRTGLAKGLNYSTVIMKHVLKNAMIPPITLLGIQLAVLVGGTVVTETVFARQGLGQLLVTSVLNKDTPLVQALVIYVTSAYIFFNFIVDLLYGLIDPRIREARVK